MNGKLIRVTMLTLLLMSTLTLALNVETVKAEPATIVVPDDYATIQGAINAANPGDTVYVKRGNYCERSLYHDHYNVSIIVNQSITLMGEDKYNTIIYGNGTKSQLSYGVLIDSANVTFSGFTITGGIEPTIHGMRTIDQGIVIGAHSDNCLVSSNIVVNVEIGIRVHCLSECTVRDNLVINNTKDGIHGIGIYVTGRDSRIYQNCIANNNIGIEIQWDWEHHWPPNGVSNNHVYHNDILNNTWTQAYVGPCGPDAVNFWDDGYPSGGNYWSDYTGLDLYSGPYQNETGKDGIGDLPYTIFHWPDLLDKDNYPLMKPWTPKIAPGLFADLVRRKAWPEHHHYDISRDEDDYQTLYAKVKNLGNQTAWVKAVFNITKDGGFSTIIESEPMLIETEATVDLSANFGPLTDEDTGKYSVSATCLYSRNKMVWAQGKKAKTFKFNIVP